MKHRNSPQSATPAAISLRKAGYRVSQRGPFARFIEPVKKGGAS